MENRSLKCFLYFFKSLLLILCLVASLSSLSLYGATNDQEKQRVKTWVVPALGSSITKLKFKEFIEELEVTVGIRLNISYRDASEKLQGICSEHGNALIMMSQAKTAQDMIRRCNYRILAQGDSPVHLYAKTGARNRQIKKIGLARGYSASDVARRELPEKQYVYFQNYGSLLLGLLRDEVDAVAAVDVLLSAGPDSLTSKLEIIKTLKDKGGALWMVSPEFSAMPAARRLQKYILMNSQVSSQLFQTTLGLEAWYLPDNDKAFY